MTTRFRTEVEFEGRRVEVPYRWLARAVGARLELHAAIDARVPIHATAFEAPELLGQSAYGLVPTAIARGAAPSFEGDSVADASVSFGTSAEGIVRGACDVTARWSFELRTWGIKAVRFVPQTLVATGAVAEALRAMGVGQEAGAFVLEGELGVQPHVQIESIAGGFALTVEHVSLVELARPRRDPRFVLRSLSHPQGRRVDPDAPSYRFTPAIEADDALDLLRTCTDPYVAAAAACVIGEGALRDARPDLRKCAEDPAEDPDVRFACLWALTRVGDASDAPTAQRVAASGDERLRDHALKVWAKLDRHGLIASNEAHVRAFLAKYPKLARAPGRSPDATVELPGAGRSIAIAGERILIGSWGKLFAYDGRAIEVVASAEDGFESVAASRDGHRMAAVTTSGAFFFSLDDATRVVRDADGQGTVAVSPDGTHVATAFGDVTLRARDGARGAAVFAERAHIAWDGSNRLYVLPVGETVLWRWDGALTKLVDQPDAGRLAVARDGAFAITTDLHIRWWASDGSVVDLERVHAGHVSSVAFSRDGALLAAGDNEGTLAVWRRDDARPLATFDLPDDVRSPRRVSGVAIAPDNARVVAVSIDAPKLFAWNLS